MRYRLTSVDAVRADGSYLFTGKDADGEEREVLLVPCEDGPPVEAWVNRCTHEDQRLYRDGVGAVIREGGIVCPKHGSVFDACTGGCENGPAADSVLSPVDVTVEDGEVYLTDDDMRFLREGGRQDDDEDDGPSSTSHLRF